GHGLGIIRDHVAQMSAGESVAARTARNELRAVSRRIQSSLAPETPGLPQTAHVTAELANAAAIPAIGESIRVAVAGAGSAALTKGQPPATSRIEAIRESWLEQVGGKLPHLWKQSLTTVVEGREAFYTHVIDALENVRLPSPVDGRARLLRFIGIALLVIGVITAGVGAILNANIALLITGGGVVALGLIAIFVARSMRSRSARTRSQEYLNQITVGLAAVVH